MNMSQAFAVLIVMLFACLQSGWSQIVPAPPRVTTGQYDIGRTNSNPNETLLNTSNVKANTFGLLFSRNLDGMAFAQPLYYPGVPIPGQTTAPNVVFVATLNNTIYAFDADRSTVSNPYWSKSLGTAITFGAPIRGIPEVGILGTPVLDPSSGTLYAVAASVDPLTGKDIYKLHALDWTNGAEKFNGPVTIQASVPGTGDDSQNGMIPFLASFPNGDLKVFQRTALLLLNGSVYFAFGSAAAENLPYHGWVFEYDATTLAQTSVTVTTPNGPPGDPRFPCTNGVNLGNVCGHAAGVWMSGRGIAGDPTLGIFYATGNGGVGDGNQGESVINFSPSAIAGNFNFFLPDGPHGYIFLNQNDLDFGTGGVLLPPSATSVLITMGKTGEIYLLHRSHLGGFGNANACQIFQGSDAFCSNCSKLHGPAYWDEAPNSTPLLYIWPTGEHLRSFGLQSSTNACGKQFNTTAVSSNSAIADYPGGMLAISSNHGKAGTGILWATGVTIDPNNAAAPHVPTLWAFDAGNLATELFSATLAGVTKFNVPTVVNGKVYVAQSGSSASDFKLLVYGLFVPGS
jgi:hypothetical protein